MPENEQGPSAGNISNISGNVNIAGSGQIMAGDRTTDAPPPKLDVARLFDPVYAAIDARPETSAMDKGDLKDEVKEIEVMITEAATKTKKFDERFLSRHLHTIAGMAPDVVEVLVAVLMNPSLGFSHKVSKAIRREMSGGKGR